ncbi:MAG: methyltransferase domain-containing protein [Candidatus Yanofskybacteria bacterium]|nr:methyltransferase domain-containing protein [Candidatus Yanofskybacteria bacterium]
MPNKNKIAERKTCRISGEKLRSLFSLGKTYISDFVSPDKKPHLPPIDLKLCLAHKSGLVQLAHTAPSDEMYRHYWYRSGTNATMTKELEEIARSIQNLIKTKPGDVFIDIGCNDGTLLSFLDKGLIRIGFDPAQNGFKELSSEHANLIIDDYFSYNALKKSKYGNNKAMAITSIAMFYDLEDPNKFVRGIAQTLHKDGLWVLQMSYLPLMLEQLAFDNLCHEHLEYYSLESLKYLLDKHGLKIVDCQFNDVNGGSFRVYIRKNNADESRFSTAPYRSVASYRVLSTLSHERSLNLKSKKTYFDFYKKSLDLKRQTVSFIKKEKARGKTIWGYGASTKGNTLLQWFGLDGSLIDAIAERSPAKFGLKTVGTNIPITSEEEMRKAQPDYLLIMPWHFIKEFKQREAEYLKKGGKFIVPCPKFEIISI